MLPDLERLITLQQVDADAADARRHIAAHPDLVKAADARLAAARAVVDAARLALKTSQDERRELEKQAALFQGRLSKFRDQQSAVKTNREYQALGHEIETATAELGAVEEQEITKMVEADGLTAAVKDAEALLAARQKDVDAEKAALAQALAGHEARLKDALAARAGIVAGLSAPALAIYEQVARVRKGVGLSLAQDGLCSACHVRLRPTVYQQVRRNDALVQCESCQRILYFVAPPASAEPAQPAATAS
ncbi:MAG: zinc ribbon domain-containing protein [Vicinamibacterales bacterium]